jgi:hypothetical protein
LGITIAIASVFAFAAAVSRHMKHVQFAYHGMHALAMVVYALAILFFGNTPEKLMAYTAFLLFFYGFSEIIFCNWLFNLKQKVVYTILVVRLILALATGIATVIGMYFPNLTVGIFGAVFIMIGVNVILYVPIIKECQLRDVKTVV